jgi:hypothetical protein
MSTTIHEDNCIQEDKLRAYLDSELTAVEAADTSSHLASCAACAARVEILRSDAAAVESLLVSLAPEQALPTSAPALLPVPQRHRVARFGWTAAISLGALAVVIVAALLLLTRHTAPQTPGIGKQQPAQSAPSPVAVDQNKQSVVPQQAKQNAIPSPATHKNASLRPQNHNQVRVHFIRLDNDGPIESGLVYRVKLPGSLFTSLDPAVISSQISADVVVDSSGRPRAIRFLSSLNKSIRQGE